MLRKKIITVTMTLICALAGVGAIGMSASAAEEANTATARSTCHLVAEVARSGADVKFTGGRVGCATSATVTVRARRDIPLSPDQNLDTRTFIIKVKSKGRVRYENRKSVCKERRISEI